MMISSKNSKEAVLQMLKDSSASLLLIDARSKFFADSLDLSISVFSFIESYQLSKTLPGYVPDEPTPSERESEMKNPAFYLHTSGSTGHPKLIAQIHTALFLTHPLSRPIDQW